MRRFDLLELDILRIPKLGITRDVEDQGSEVEQKQGGPYRGETTTKYIKIVVLNELLNSPDPIPGHGIV